MGQIAGIENASQPLPLPMFEEQIVKYELLQQEIQKLPNAGECGWIRIDSRPIKNVREHC